MDDQVTITLPMDQHAAIAVAAVVGITLLSLVVYAVLAAMGASKGKDMWTDLRSTLGMPLKTGVGKVSLLAVGSAYVILFLLALLVTFRLLWMVFHGETSSGADASPNTTLGLGALLVALIGAPFLIWRTVVAQKTLDTAQRQTDLQDEALFNDKINAAATDLAARRQVTRIVQQDGKDVVLTEWEDDLVTRAAAIDRLEGLALEAMDRGDFAPAQRIARMLSIYVQELSLDHPPHQTPSFSDSLEFQDWASKLRPLVRSDMERAAQALGRINPMNEDTRTSFMPSNIDLRRCNLQFFDLSNLNFRGSQLDDANLLAANLSKSKINDSTLRGINLSHCNMSNMQVRGVVFERAAFDSTYLHQTSFFQCTFRHVRFQHNNFSTASFIGCFFEKAWFNASPNYGPIGGNFSGSAVINMSETTLGQFSLISSQIFSDGSSRKSFIALASRWKSKIGKDISNSWPQHWPLKKLDYDPQAPCSSEFIQEWRKWASSIEPPIAIAPDYRKD
ncbi:pentapeptide repeat-containing protein [Roseibacterium beibuensis]|uniref:Pentapeptide repeat-containing protein n=1 Tax=[Roseibacterium] beibuensis TaxID=1193142 RepID=A0ABP9LAA7_9RHOB|nr:pentapeptide repeat-containing protein [Roseibacterium beibuensis]MCS6624068.1 pentapeptide repeat-containing protein [Roseibacterium beibuensis]